MSSVAFASTGNLLASGTEDGGLFLWDLSSHRESGEPLRESQDDLAPIKNLTFTEDGKRLIVGGGSVDPIWDLASRQPVDTRDGPAASRSIAVSPRGKLLASSSSSGIILWDASTLRRVGQFLKPRARYLCDDDRTTTLVFSVDESLLISAGEDGGLVVWDVATRQQLGRPFSEPQCGSTSAFAGSAAISPNGQLVAAPIDGALVLWTINPEIWRQRACDIANRDFTLPEWHSLFGNEEPYRATCDGKSTAAGANTQ